MGERGGRWKGKRSEKGSGMSRVVAGLIAVIMMVGALAAACGNSTDALPTPTASPGQLLTGIPNNQIDGSTNSDRMELAAQDASPGVSADAAVRTAKMQQANASVLQTVLIDYTNLVQPSPSTHLAWVVNFDPATVVPIPPDGCMTNCQEKTSSARIGSTCSSTRIRARSSTPRVRPPL
jgi:hypothetical protein